MPGIKRAVGGFPVQVPVLEVLKTLQEPARRIRGCQHLQERDMGFFRKNVGERLLLI